MTSQPAHRQQASGAALASSRPAAHWRAEALGSIEALTLRLPAADAAALVAAANSARARHAAPEHVARRAFRFDDRLGALFATLRARLRDGHGALLLRGLPALPAADASWLLWGIGAGLGDAEPQDAAGSLLHHVRDVGSEVADADHVRGFQTSGALDFHNDGGEAFALYCVAAGHQGGDSLMVSAGALYDELLRLRPDLAAALREPIDFDARAQQRGGASRLQRAPIFVQESGRSWVLYKRGYIHLGQRFPEAQRLTAAQVEAMDLLDALCRDPRFHLRFRLQPGDLQLASNFSVLHARTAFRDGEGTTRHLLRLWLTLDDGNDVPQAYAHTREFAGTWRRRRAAEGRPAPPAAGRDGSDPVSGAG